MVTLTYQGKPCINKNNKKVLTYNHFHVFEMTQIFFNNGCYK